jgi:hypothetical protein
LAFARRRNGYSTALFRPLMDVHTHCTTQTYQTGTWNFHTNATGFYLLSLSFSSFLKPDPVNLFYRLKSCFLIQVQHPVMNAGCVDKGVVDQLTKKVNEGKQISMRTVTQYFL